MFADNPDATLRDIAIADAAHTVTQWSHATSPRTGLPQTAGADRVFVLDDWLNPAAVGVTGEVYYAGGGVDAAARTATPATALRYPENPYRDSDDTAYLYRTGDRARWSAEGGLEYVASGDLQVQAALEALPGVAAAATRYWETRGGPVLGAYVVLTDPASPLDTAALPEPLAALPITVLDALTGPLPRPVITSAAPSEPARTETERALAAMLTDLLSAERFGRLDDFFTLGGDSILAVQLAARARDAGMPLTARMVFEHPVLAELAAAVDAKVTHADVSVDAHHEPMAASGLSSDELAALTAGWGTDN